MDEAPFLRKTLRVYRTAFRDLLELVDRTETWTGRRVREVLLGAQAKVERLKPLAPASVLPEAARQRARAQPLEDF
jgi:hypothetical protein